MTNLLNGLPIVRATGFGQGLLQMVGLTIVFLPIIQMWKGRSKKVLSTGTSENKMTNDSLGDDDLAVLFAEQPSISKCTAD